MPCPNLVGRFFNQHHDTEHRQKGHHGTEVKRCGGVGSSPQPASNQTGGQKGEAGHTVIQAIGGASPFFGDQISGKSLPDSLESSVVETVAGEK
ncbi:MAG: hypothetical protein CL877_04230 [Dehalococcoidales bacterium]|nr:hypothetical protein [Dehalococcoidales bacterium]MDP6222124.1 hypothetical protein [Dehalococcoidales bacterium]HJM36476.1 hypothetical protein [Dehalococcoidales bacterium]